MRGQTDPQTHPDSIGAGLLFPALTDASGLQLVQSWLVANRAVHSVIKESNHIHV